MKKNDVVYVLKNGISSDEIRYSVRSVEKNFPHRRIWFVGGTPEGVEPDGLIEYTQVGASKWARSTDTIRLIATTEDITDDFWLFNDDFFIIKRLTQFPPMVMGTLEHRVQRIFSKHNMNTAYSKQLQDTRRVLKVNKLDTLDYAVHCPMLINKAKALKTLKKFKGYPMFRSLYGNHHRIGGQLTSDFKVFGLDELPRDGVAVVSTTDKSFRDGAVGEYIRDMFNEPSKHERLRS